MATTLPNTHVVNTSADFVYQQSFTYGITGGMVLLSKHATRFTRGKDVGKDAHETIGFAVERYRKVLVDRYLADLWIFVKSTVMKFGRLFSDICEQ